MHDKRQRRLTRCWAAWQFRSVLINRVIGLFRGVFVYFVLSGLVLGLAASAQAQPTIQFKSRELQEGRNFLQRLTGAMTVGESSGAASYSYPIALPPGRGVAPSVALVYSSSAGFSEYGYGWELTIPLIERDPTDGVPRYDATDRFRYRSGHETRRLVYTGQTTPEGFWVYREESETTFSRYLLGFDNHWRILSPDGKRLELGTSYSARRGNGNLDLVGKTATWFASRLIDTHGNYVSYEYAQDRQGRAMPAAIRYTGNTTTGAAPLTTVTFQWVPHWAATNDVPFSYRRGYKDEFGASRLASITVTTPPVAMGTSPAQVPASSPTTTTYTLTYPSPTATATNSHIYFRPEGIQLGTTPPVAFSYQLDWPTDTNHIASATLTGVGLPRSLGFSETEHGIQDVSRSKRILADVTGDGRQDIVDATRCTSGEWDVWRNNGTWFEHEAWPLPRDPNNNLTLDACAVRRTLLATGAGTDALTHQDLVDLTGDGYPDILYYIGQALHVCRGTGSGFLPCTIWGAFPTGSSIQGVLRRERTDFGSVTYTDADLVDFNADGFVDRVSVVGQSLPDVNIEVIYNDHGHGWGTRSTYRFLPCQYLGIAACLRLTTNVVIAGVGNRHLHTEFRDINGDGLPDYVSWNSNGGATRLSPGTGGDYGPMGDMQNSASLLGAGNQTTNGDYTAVIDLVDINGDRLPDLLENVPGAIRVRYNFGGGWESGNAAVTYPLPSAPGFHPARLSYVKPDGADGSYTEAAFTDLNGDDVPEFVLSPQDGTPAAFATFSLPYQRARALAAIFTLNGAASTHIAYKAYGPGVTPFAVHAPVEVTRSRAALYPGEPSTLTQQTTTYDYEDPAYDRATREFRGFGSVRMDQLGGGVFTQTYFLQGQHTQGKVASRFVANVAASSAPRYETNVYTEVPLGNGAAFARLDRSDAAEGGIPWGSRSLSTYYSDYFFGQPGTVTQDAEGGLADDVTNTTIFTVRNDASFLMVAPSSFTRAKGGTLVAGQSWFYDNPAIPGATPTKGNVVRATTLLDAATSAIEDRIFDDEAGPGYGLVLSSSDAENAKTTYVYDTNYHQYQVASTDPIGTTHTSYHALDGSVADACGPRHTAATWACSRREIDQLGRVTAAHVPDFQNGEFAKALTTQLSYDDWVMPLKMTEVIDASRRVQYRDGFGNVVEVKVHDGTGYRTYETIADPLGHALSAIETRTEAAEAYAHGTGPSIVSYTYDDVRGEIETATFARDPGDTRPPATFSRVNGGPTVDVTDEEGRRSIYTLDGFGRVSTLQRGVGTSVQATTQFSYDGNDHVNAIVDGNGLLHSYEFDMGGRQVGYTAPDGGTRTNRFNGRGQLVSVIDAANVKVEYLRDEAGRLRQVQTVNVSADSKPVSEATEYYGEEAPQFLGLVRSITSRDSGLSKSYTSYDARGGVTEVSFLHNSGTLTMSFNRDTLGRLRDVTYPDGFSLKYDYNGADDIRSIGQGGALYAILSYDSQGRLATITNDFGLSETVAYDVRDRPVHIVSRNTAIPTPLVDDTLAWGDAGDLAGVTVAGLPVGGGTRIAPDDIGYHYDALGRLDSATKNGSITSTYTYLPNGATDVSTVAGTTQTNTYVTDRLTSQTWTGGSRTFDYDPNGSVTAQTTFTGAVPTGSRTLYWDDLGRIAATTENDTDQVYYEYLGEERIRTDRYTRDGDESILEFDGWMRFNPRTGEHTNHVLAGDRIVAELRDGNRVVALPHRSFGSSVVAVTSADGTVLRQEEYSPYGLTTATSGSDPFENHFHGLRQDQLLVAGGRIYDPAVGRWLGRDKALRIANSPLADVRLLDGYGYGFSAPTNYSDPNGHWPSWSDVWHHVKWQLIDPTGQIRYNKAFIDETASLINNEQSFWTYMRHVVSNAMREAQFKNPVVGLLVSGPGADLVDDRDDDQPMSPQDMIARGSVASPGGLVHAPRTGWLGVSRGWFRGVKSYDQLRYELRGTGLQAHHIIEKRFARLFGMKAGDMAAVAVTPFEHNQFTQAWRREIPYIYGTQGATRSSVLAAARRVYANNPEILQAIGLQP